MSMVVAVDGTAGSGKSSVSKGAADRLGMQYLDTGAMYRAITWWCVENGIDVADPAAVAAIADQPQLVIATSATQPEVRVDGVDATTAIRTPVVTAAVSAVSAVPQVRAALVQRQRQIVDDATRAGQGIIVEGRDIGTVVLPTADLKVFLHADPRVRAARRAAEDAQRGHGADVSATVTDLLRRDAADSTRAASPLKQADDAVVLDATDDNLATMIDKMIELIESRRR
jgi:CMP/dCMP kinase